MAMNLSITQIMALRRANTVIMKNRIDENPLKNRSSFTNYTLYECCAMYHLDLYMYGDIPPKLFRDAPPNFKTHKLQDMGIDGLSGDFKTAVQVKFNSPGNNVTYTAISTFNTCCMNLGTVTRKIIVTPNNVHLPNNIENLHFEHFIISDEQFLDFYKIAAKFDIRPQKNTNIIPLYRWQEEAILLLGNKLASINPDAEQMDRQIKLNASCASGKTRVIAELIHRGNYYPCIVFANSNDLVSQLCNEISKWTRQDIKISSTMKSNTADIYITTYKSWKSVSKMGENIEKFKLCVIDEAHNVEDVFDDKAAASATISSKSIYSIINKERTLLLSASLKDLECDFKYDLVDAIDNGDVVDFNILLSKSKQINDTIKLIADDNSLQRILAYCKNLTDAEEFQTQLKKLDISNEIISSKTSAITKQRNVSQFEDGKVRVLIMANVFIEGIDIPSADTCLFVNNIAKKKITQCIGRVLRNWPGKSSASIIFTHMENAYLEELFSIDNRLRDLSSLKDLETTINPRICHF